MNIHKSIILLAALALTGCGIYGKYERPAEAQAPEGLYRQSSADTASLANLSWRELFTDPLLQQLVEEGLAANTDLKVALLKVEEAEASLRASSLAFLPSLSLNPQANLKGGSGSEASKTWNLTASSAWEVDIFGRQLNSRRRAQSLLEQSEAYSQAVRTKLVATIAGSYYSLLMLDEQLGVSERTLGNWEENLRATTALKKAGMSTQMAVAQTQARKLSVEASILSLQKQVLALENSLSALLGRVPGAIDRSSLSAQSFPEELSAGLPVQLLVRRPDIRSAEAELAAAFYATAEARSAFYPSLNLSGSAGWTGVSGATVSDPASLIYSAAASLVQPIFSKGKNAANLKAAKARQEAALHSFRQSILDAGVEVNDALSAWETARKKLQLDQKQCEALDTALKGTELLMKHSSHNYLEVISARQSLLQAELDVVADRFDEIQAVISLYRALGGGLRDTPSPKEVE